jgi:hypothetical protein
MLSQVKDALIEQATKNVIIGLNETDHNRLLYALPSKKCNIKGNGYYKSHDGKS